MNTTIKILTLTLITFLLNIKTTKSQCNIDDWTALKALYESTDGDNWTKRDGWDIQIDNQSSSPANCNLSNLYGVELDENGRVSCIDLDGSAKCNYLSNGGNGLTGTIPVELGNLTYLNKLYLNSNNLTGNIPNELGNLTNLTDLKLAFNQLSGNIPVELSGLSNLTELSLSYNDLSGNIPSQLGNLSSLTKLQLSSNQLTGTIPLELSNLTNLIDLSLDSNQLSGNIPSVLGNLENLNHLILNGNLLTGSIPSELGDLVNLVDLNLYSNNLSGDIPPELGNLTSLDRLLLNTNQLSGSMPVELGNLTNLTELALNSNNLTGSIPTQIGDFINLIVLKLHVNGLTGTIPASIGNLTNLVALNLSFNDLEGNIPTEIGNLINLESLDFRYNLLTGPIPAQISNLSVLRKLLLGVNALNGTIPSEIGQLVNLESLWIDVNDFSGNIPEEIGNLTNLYHLSLADNELTGSIPPELGNLTNLTQLYLNTNNLSGEVPSFLGNLINLEKLSLHENQFAESIPSEFCNLINLLDFRVFSNQLTGCYPACISVFCDQLTYADISYENNFNATWEDFCASNAGVCSPDQCVVYPGDLNNDGIVNNQDVGLSGLYLFEVGPPRTTEHQNTNWYAHPAEDWNRQHLNNEDIKHFDCNGDGAITDDDRQAVEDNFGQTWSPSNTTEMPAPPVESDYQVMLHPIKQMSDGFLIMNVALERRAGGNVNLRGGYFTIDYSDITGNISNATLNFEPTSWLGIPNINLRHESTPFTDEKKIEVGFTKTNNLNSEGSGVIGQLILAFDNAGARLGKKANAYEFQVNTIGVHNSENFTQIEDQVLQVNVDNSNYCQTNWLIDENTAFQNQYKSNNDISTNGFVIIGEDQEVIYQANRITLNSGFKVKAGADFSIGIGNCTE